jgi:hypothetical protein
MMVDFGQDECPVPRGYDTMDKKRKSLIEIRMIVEYQKKVENDCANL